MASNPPDIDITKLRALLRRRQHARDQSRALTDQFLDVRDEIARLEATYNRPGRHVDKLTRQRERAAMDALKEQRAQIQADREQASQALAAHACLASLVDYARRSGYVVDEDRCTVRRKQPTEPQKVHV